MLLDKTFPEMASSSFSHVMSYEQITGQLKKLIKRNHFRNKDSKSSDIKVRGTVKVMLSFKVYKNNNFIWK